MRALGIEGISKSEVSRICSALDAGNDEGSAWSAFVRSRVNRGLYGVRLVISNDHAGFVKAVHKELLGSDWQRCRVHFIGNAQGPRAALGPEHGRVGHPDVFEQPDGASVREQLDRVIDGMARPYSRVADLLTAAEPDLFTHFASPSATAAGSAAPTRSSSDQAPARRRRHLRQPRRGHRLVGMVLAEQDDEWQDGGRYFLPESMTAIDAAPIEEHHVPDLTGTEAPSPAPLGGRCPVICLGQAGASRPGSSAATSTS